MSKKTFTPGSDPRNPQQQRDPNKNPQQDQDPNRNPQHNPNRDPQKPQSR